MKRKIKRQKIEVHLGKEVKILGRHIVTAIKSTVTSQDVKAIGGEALGGVRATGHRVIQVLRKAKESDAAHNVKNQAERVVEIGKKRTASNTKKLRRNLAKGLDKIGQELQNLAHKIHKK